MSILSMLGVALLIPLGIICIIAAIAFCIIVVMCMHMLWNMGVEGDGLGRLGFALISALLLAIPGIILVNLF